MFQAIRKYAVDPFKEGDTAGGDTDEQGQDEEASLFQEDSLHIQIPNQEIFEQFSDGDKAPNMDDSPEPVHSSRTKSDRGSEYLFRIQSDQKHF